MRLAYIHLRFGRWQESLDHLDKIDPQTGDAFVAYLRAYFRGWLLERLRRPDDAVASYKAALAVVPNGPSTVEWLAILLFSLNRRSEAFALAAIRRSRERRRRTTAGVFTMAMPASGPRTSGVFGKP